MQLFKKLPCENYDAINQQLLDWVNTTNLVESNNFWNPVEVKKILSSCPLFKQWLLENKILVQSIGVTIGKRINCCPPHIDTPPARYKLSWPVQNTKGTFNKWYSVKDHTKVLVNHLGGHSYDYDNLIEIEQTEVLFPMIIDAGVVHDVFFESKVFPRIGLQCKLFNEPSIL